MKKPDFSREIDYVKCIIIDMLTILSWLYYVNQPLWHFIYIYFATFVISIYTNRNIMRYYFNIYAIMKNNIIMKVYTYFFTIFVKYKGFARSIMNKYAKLCCNYLLHPFECGFFF